ncbi:MAG: hypothetical protein M3O62_16360 [Pseudomonadota bacterium]|nr:hypothetical protein [Pseudomonadota bacterium]
MTKNKNAVLLCSVLLPCLTGCASIIKGRSQDVEFRSTPSEATFMIRDLNNRMSPISGTTPGKATLKRGAGYFDGAEYEVTVSKNGYAPATVPLTSSANMAYGLGNLLVGGLIGYLAVDPATGAMWDLKPDVLDVTLGPLGSGQPVEPALVPTAPMASSHASPTYAPAPVAAQPYSPPPPSPVSRESAVPAPAPAPAAAAAGSRNELTPTAGQPVRLTAPTPYRDAPVQSRPIKAMLQAGTDVLMRNRITNAEGDWWFVQTDADIGWIPATP